MSGAAPFPSTLFVAARASDRIAPAVSLLASRPAAEQALIVGPTREVAECAVQKDCPAAHLCQDGRCVPGCLIDGDCGGFNLHWAWASGLTAGRSAALSLED